MKYSVVVLCAVHAAMAQTGPPAPAGIAGTVVDLKTSKPIPAALVMASRSGASRLTRTTKSGGDGAFRIDGLMGGSYSLCVQPSGDQYLDPCQWSGTPTTVALAAGQNAGGILLKLTQASLVNIQVRDAQKVLNQLTRDGRRPDLSIGVWGPNGLYYPAPAQASQVSAGTLQPGIPTYSYQLAVPRDIPLNLHIASRDLKLGDAAGVALPANSSQQAFRNPAGDANAKTFTFSILGRLP